MAARAAAADARAEADEESRRGRPAQAEVLAHLRGASEQVPCESSRYQAGDKRTAPCSIARRLSEEPMQDAADTGDAAVRRQQPDAGDADQQSAEEGGDWGKVSHE